MAKRNYLFDWSKPAWLKKREAKERAQKRSAAAKRGAATRKARAAGSKTALDTKQIRDKINYINRRIRKYGDPDNAVRMLSAELRTETGMIAKTPESLQFFASRQWMLDKIQSQIRKHLVSNEIRDAFEQTLSSIYDQMQEIGSEEFYRITGGSLRSAIETDNNTDKKMLDVIRRWTADREKIAQYYEEQVRGGKLTPYTD